MNNNEEYFVTLIGKYVSRTKYLIFHIMSSAVRMLTSVISMVWNMILSFARITSSCGTRKLDPWVWGALQPDSCSGACSDQEAASEFCCVEIQGARSAATEVTGINHAAEGTSEGLWVVLLSWQSETQACACAFAVHALLLETRED